MELISCRKLDNDSLTFILEDLEVKEASNSEDEDDGWGFLMSTLGD